MDHEVRTAVDGALSAIRAAASAADLEAVRVKYLGRRNGILPALFSAIRSLAPEKRKARGMALKQARSQIEQALAQQAAAAESAAPAAGPTGDHSLPGLFAPTGRLHPLTQVTNEVVRILACLGFDVAEGPEVELEWYNFDALNISHDHPARETYQSFYLGDGRALRSQTSSVQVRIMENHPPPVRMIAPGRVFRPDRLDATHHSTFHQIEGLWVDKNVTMADLKGVLSLFLEGLLGPQARLRLRPSFFPFTEPSAEMDVSCMVCGGKGCPACAHTGFIEMGGCGMVDPNVFDAVGIDNEKYTGWAFGFGIERLAMKKYGIGDIRLLFENDLRFLEQF